MYRVVLTDSATDNEVAAARGGPGALLQYEHREAAAAAAERYSEEGDVPVRLQAPAPQDPRDVDAYLVAIPERRVRRPEGSLDEGLSFETSAAQYGALGEALLTSHEQDPPILLAYARRTMGADDADGDTDDDSEDGETATDGDPTIDEETTTDGDPANDADPAIDAEPAVQLDAEPDPVSYRNRDTDEEVTWIPDCAATVTVGGSIERRFLCEVKTGDASTERDQRQVMRWAGSEDEREVLLVRIDVEDLPDGYTARIQEIEPEAPGREWIRGDADRTLGEFH